MGKQKQKQKVGKLSKQNNKLSKQHGRRLIDKMKKKPVKKHKWGTNKNVKSISVLPNRKGLGSGKETKPELDNVKATPTPTLKKTTLREKMMRKLSAARFRQINEQLDSGTGNSTDAFENNSDLYFKYHEAYNVIKDNWEFNPLDHITNRIKQIQSINKSKKKLVVGDFGCGNGDLLRAFDSNKEVKMFGFDLFKLHPATIVCNMKKIPLKDNSLDVAVFCLSLMAKDVSDFIKEANRLLRKGGTLIVAEAESRILGGVNDFIKILRRYGFACLKEHEKADSNNSFGVQNNSVFVILEFKKIKNLPSNKSLDAICLKPSVYKKR